MEFFSFLILFSSVWRKNWVIKEYFVYKITGCLALFLIFVHVAVCSIFSALPNIVVAYPARILAFLKLWVCRLLNLANQLLSHFPIEEDKMDAMLVVSFSLQLAAKFESPFECQNIRYMDACIRPLGIATPSYLALI